MSDTLDQLDADLDAYVVGEVELEHDDVPLRDEKHADTALYVLAKIRRQRDEKAALFQDRIDHYKAAISELQDRRDEALAPFDHDITYWEGQLEGWTRANIPETAKRKTIKMPFGSVSLRKRQDVIALVDKTPGDHVPDECKRDAWATKTDIERACQMGPAMDLDELPEGYKVRDGYTPHKVMRGDAVVPGAVWEKSDRDDFIPKVGQS